MTAVRQAVPVPGLFRAAVIFSLLAFLLVFLLTGCGGSDYGTRSGKGRGQPQPPASQTDPATGRRLKGTEKPYVIQGKTYVPVLSAHGWSETGIASWYGPNFHGKRTSNGEVYDMYQMTAAHKLLPMNTMVRVTNLENGKSTDLRVNDRGPFVDGRIIDLSYAGALTLGTAGKGTARVRVESIGDVPGTEGLAPGELPGVFWIQAGAFQVQANAENLARRLRAEGRTEARSIPSTIDNIPTWRVQIGGYRSLSEAKTALPAARARFPGAFVVAE